MPDKKVKFVHPGFLPDNTATVPVELVGQDFTKKTTIHRHMEREGNGIKIVEDGVVDEDALIQSEKCNAGLENIIRLQTMRYGTLENAIKRNADKQVYADVSHIPTTVAEQSEFVSGVQADVDALAAKLGITKEELLKSTQESLAQLLAAKQAAAAQPAAAASTGGNE